MALFKREGERYYRTRFTDDTGKRIDRSTKEVNKHAAQRFEEKLRQELREQNVYGIKPKHTWKEAEDRWLKEMKHKRTLQTDISHFSYINTQPISKLKLEDITKQNIENLAVTREATGVSPATINRMLALVKAILNRAYKHWEWLDKVPHITMRKEPEGRERVEPIEVIYKIFSYLPHMHRLLGLMAIETGLRESNVRLMQWEWIDFERKKLTIPAQYFKQKRKHTIPLSRMALEIILEQRGRNPKYVFVSDDTKLPLFRCSNKTWYKALKLAGVSDFRWHDLRHCKNTWMAQKGISREKRKRWFGWANDTMADHYTHLDVDDLRDIVE